MEKFNVVLVVLNESSFEAAVRSLNLNNANIVAVLLESGGEKILTLDEKKIPVLSFESVQKFLNRGKNFLWLISGFVNSVGDLWRMKKFLLKNGVPEENIVNFEILPHISSAWIANLRYVEEHGADFFATGISLMEVGLNLNYIPHVRGRGVNLSCSNQDLRQGYLTAKHVFEHVKPGTIKFVLIGLAPYSFRYDNSKAFTVCSRNLQYMLAIDVPAKNHHDELLKLLVSDKVKNFFANITAKQADLNFNRLKKSSNRKIPANALINWETRLNVWNKKIYPETVAENFRILNDYIRLCLEHGAKPVGVLLPPSAIIQENLSDELLTLFRLAIRQFEGSHDFAFVDLFDLKLGYNCFYDLTHLNQRGSAIASSMLSLRLNEKNILPTENFCGMNYEYFDALSNLLAKDDYNALMSKVFAKSAELIRRKDKVKVGFVLYDSSMWCGDDLYNLFAADARFEPTIFLCLRSDSDDELVRKDFLHGAEQFKARGLNVVALSEKNSPVPAQDLLIFLTPYFEVLPEKFKSTALTARTLLAYLPYAFGISAFEKSGGKSIGDHAIFHTAWKIFFPSTVSLERYEKLCKVGMPRGIYGGYPRLDIFFKDDAHFHFDWKMIRPDAKKIIWAPHWTINDGVNYSTFQWNFDFMYEFAKSHPETSWVVKPHPNLLFSAVKAGVFPSAEAFNAYLQKWNDLPNAQVYTGAYYQSLFATSDGMIHDSGSFIAEYQFTHKPMIFLTRDTQKFNALGNGILDVSYRVNGRDLKGIAALMQKIFVEGKDEMFDVRKKFFDEQLNYTKQFGMLSSEFIFTRIADELKEATI